MTIKELMYDKWFGRFVISTVIAIILLPVLTGCSGQYLELRMGRNFEPQEPISVTYEESVTRAGTEKKTTTTNYLQPGDAVVRKQQ